MNEELFHQLLDRYLTGKLQEEERLQLAQMLERPEYRALLEAAMKDSFTANAYEGPPSPKRSGQMKAWLFRRMAAVSRIHMIRRWGWAAAVALLVIASGVYFRQRWAPEQQIAVAPVKDVPPGTNKAVLTLADGSTVTLDSAGSKLIRQGAAAVRQQGGSLQYEAKERGPSVSYNTLSTPRGGQFRVILSDGTKIWLNAASSIRYPTVFTGAERRVELSGEAYFQVVKNERQPFRVVAPGTTTIEVSGTDFNVQAYSDEERISTTLLSGSVLVSNEAGRALLKPGEQAQTTGDARTAVKVIKHVSLDKVVAWKNGVFNFEGAGLQEAMKQIARWYDIEVIYENGVPDIEFIGGMSRNVPLPVLLKWLQQFGIRFRIENGRRLIVTP